MKALTPHFRNFTIAVLTLGVIEAPMLAAGERTIGAAPADLQGGLKRGPIEIDDLRFEAGLRERVAIEGFFVVEGELQRNAVATPPTLIARQEAAEQPWLVLARFYAAYGLYIEALAALPDIKTSRMSDQQRIFAARCHLALNRNRRALALLNEVASPGGPAAALRAVALTRLGAYAEANRLFTELGAEGLAHADAPSPEEWRLAAIEAAVGAEETGRATMLIERAKRDGALLTDPRFALASAVASLAKGDEERGASTLARLVETAPDPIAARARAILLAREVRSNGATEETVETSLRLSLRARHGEAARDVDAVAGEVALARYASDGGDLEPVFRHWRRIIDHHPESDLAFHLQSRLAELLPKLLVADPHTSPLTAARVFFENVDLAPPGEAGDALIRTVADHLSNVGLQREAGELLEHQVFRRLRGAERARVAATLGQLYLDDQRPAEALRAIRSTRIAGIDAALVDRRRLIEARALAGLGRFDEALALVGDDGSVSGIGERASIHWMRRDYDKAAADYAKMLQPQSTDASSALRRTAALRAAAAYMLNGDLEGLSRFIEMHGDEIDGESERNLVRALEEGVAREDFLDKYRSVFSATRS